MHTCHPKHRSTSTSSANPGSGAGTGGFPLVNGGRSIVRLGVMGALGAALALGPVAAPVVAYAATADEVTTATFSEHTQKLIQAADGSLTLSRADADGLLAQVQAELDAKRAAADKAATEHTSAAQALADAQAKADAAKTTLDEATATLNQAKQAAQDAHQAWDDQSVKVIDFETKVAGLKNLVEQNTDNDAWQEYVNQLAQATMQLETEKVEAARLQSVLGEANTQLTAAEQAADAATAASNTANNALTSAQAAETAAATNEQAADQALTAAQADYEAAKAAYDRIAFGNGSGQGETGGNTSNPDAAAAATETKNDSASSTSAKTLPKTGDESLGLLGASAGGVGVIAAAAGLALRRRIRLLG